MSSLILPANSDYALALREPNLLVPGKQSLGRLVPNRLHPLYPYLEGYLLPQDAFIYGETRIVSGIVGAVRNTAFPDNTGPKSQTLNPVSHLPTYSVVVLVTGTFNAYTFGSVIYAERPNTAQIFKLTAAPDDETSLSFVTRNASSQGLINNATSCAIDTSRQIKTLGFAKFSDTSRWLYTDTASAQNTTSSGGTYNFNTGQLFADPLDSGSKNNDAAAALVLTFSKAITRTEFDLIRADPWNLFTAANDTPYLISIPGGASYPVTLSNPTASATGQTTATASVTVTVA